MDDEKYCIGCGVKLQDSNMLFEGYTVAEAVDALKDNTYSNGNGTSEKLVWNIYGNGDYRLCFVDPYTN